MREFNITMHSYGIRIGGNTKKTYVRFLSTEQLHNLRHTSKISSVKRDETKRVFRIQKTLRIPSGTAQWVPLKTDLDTSAYFMADAALVQRQGLIVPCTLVDDTLSSGVLIENWSDETVKLKAGKRIGRVTTINEADIVYYNVEEDLKSLCVGGEDTSATFTPDWNINSELDPDEKKDRKSVV